MKIKGLSYSFPGGVPAWFDEVVQAVMDLALLGGLCEKTNEDQLVTFVSVNMWAT